MKECSSCVISAARAERRPQIAVFTTGKAKGLGRFWVGNSLRLWYKISDPKSPAAERRWAIEADLSRELFSER
jgi:hypothetical protein